MLAGNNEVDYLFYEYVIYVIHKLIRYYNHRSPICEIVITAITVKPV